MSEPKDAGATFESEVAAIDSRVRSLRAQGLTGTQIRNQLPGVSQWAVNCAINRDAQALQAHPGLRNRAKDADRERARTLRLSGKTYKQIRAEIRVSNSTLSLWLRDLPYPKPDRAAHAAHMHRVRSQRSAERRVADKAKAEAEIGHLTDRDLFILGVGLYWAEGTKDRLPQGRHRERTTFINSDPAMITTFLAWLRLVGVPPERCQFRVSIHESAVVSEAEEYWQRVTGAPAASFKRATIKKHNPVTRRLKTGDDYHGCLVVDVLRSAELYRRVEGWWQGISVAATASDTASWDGATSPSRGGFTRDPGSSSGRTSDFGSEYGGSTPPPGAVVRAPAGRDPAGRLGADPAAETEETGVSDEPVRPAAVLILAAGEGTRMKSATPKVLHTLGGRSMVGHAVAAARGVLPERLVVVIGHSRERLVEHLAGIDPAIRTVVQEVQNGTGHAVRVAMEAITAQDGGIDGTVVVTYGDTPLLTARTVAQLIAEHEEAGNAATLLTAVPDDPTGYGRVLRDGDAIVRVVEQKDATAGQRAIREVNSGVYAFDAKLLMAALARLTASNAQGEEYLTDVVEILVGDGRAVGGLRVADPREILGANDRLQLAGLRRILNDRIAAHWMIEGVTVVDPATTWIDVDVQLDRDVELLPNTQLHGATRIETGARVGPNCTLTDTLVGAGARVTNTTGDGAQIGPEATVGPYTYLRPGTRLGRGAKAGGFVEMKNAEVGEGSKVPHLSYIGDTRIGVGSNIGAGTITANYDGVAKHRTEIGDHVFIGSDSVLIAPASVADGAYVAAGSAITNPVPAGAIGVARGRQSNIEGWVERKRSGTKSAAAAKAAQAAGAEAEAAGAAEEHGSGDGAQEA